MKEYSLENADFKRISFSQISVLINTLAQSGVKDFSYIKERYSKSGKYFDETFQFLAKLDVVNVLGNEIYLSVPFVSDIKSYFLDHLFRKAYRIPVLDTYFRNFTLQQKGAFCFQPQEKLNLQTSGIRNLLMELGMLTYDSSTRTYFISDEGIPYLSSFFRRTSAAELEKILRQKDKLGLRAELVVLALEKKKLKNFPELQKNIQHVSRFDVGAGYDIQSFSADTDRSYQSKYIEVKAVSEKDFSFFWSINELETAKHYGKQYNLYLVPVSGGGKFNLKSLKIIQNPYEKIYNQKGGKVDSVLFHVLPDILNDPN